MRAHLIKDGVVVDTMEVESLDFMEGLVEATAGGIGWTLVDGEFVEPEPQPIPKELHNANILAALEEIDRKTIRPLSEGETDRVAVLRAEASALRAKLIK